MSGLEGRLGGFSPTPSNPSSARYINEGVASILNSPMTNGRNPAKDAFRVAPIACCCIGLIRECKLARRALHAPLVDELQNKAGDGVAGIQGLVVRHMNDEFVDCVRRRRNGASKSRPQGRVRETDLGIGASTAPARGLVTRSRAALGISAPVLRPGRVLRPWTGTGGRVVTPVEKPTIFAPVGGP